MKFRFHVKPVPEINMIPMIDVIMMLLIFFLVATQMSKNPPSSVVLPESLQAVIKDLEETGMITVSVLSDSKDGKPYQVGTETMGYEELVRLLQLGGRAEHDLRGQDPVVRIRADRDAQLSQVQNLLMACQKAMIAKVFIATQNPAE
jgi:biopolymer transport protein ExbD